MKKEAFKTGMMLRISAGNGTYSDKKWASIIRVIAVTRYNGEVSGFQYQTIAERGKDHDPNFLLYNKQIAVQVINTKLDSWMETFKPKLLV